MSADRAAAAGSTTVVGQLPPPVHGSAVMTVRLIEALTASGRRVHVVDRRFSRNVHEVGRPGIRKIIAVPSLIVRFAAAARRSDRVVLLITSTPGSFLIDSLLLALTRRPVVLYVHTVGYRTLAARGRLWELLVRRAFARAAEVVVLGPTLRGDLTSFVAEARLHVIPNSTPAPDAPITPRTSGTRLLFLANLLPGKGADVFVRLAHSLVAQHPDTPWRFDLAGAGDASLLGVLPAEMTVHGRVAGAVKEALLQDADVLVVPSTYVMEAQPLVIVEALAHGVPVVAYDTGGIRDLVDDGVGRLVPAGDEHALTAAVVDLLTEPVQLARTGEAAAARFVLRHSPAAYVAAWRALLDRPLLHAPERAAARADAVRASNAGEHVQTASRRSAAELPVDA